MAIDANDLAAGTPEEISKKVANLAKPQPPFPLSDDLREKLYKSSKICIFQIGNSEFNFNYKRVDSDLDKLKKACARVLTIMDQMSSDTRSVLAQTCNIEIALKHGISVENLLEQIEKDAAIIKDCTELTLKGRQRIRPGNKSHPGLSQYIENLASVYEDATGEKAGYTGYGQSVRENDRPFTGRFVDFVEACLAEILDPPLSNHNLGEAIKRVIAGRNKQA